MMKPMAVSKLEFFIKQSHMKQKNVKVKLVDRTPSEHGFYILVKEMFCFLDQMLEIR